MVSFDEDAPWAPAVIRPADWRLATADEIVQDSKARAHNEGRPPIEWLMPVGVTDREGKAMVVAVTHGAAAGGGTLCGIPGVAEYVYRHPFYGTNIGDCRVCAEKLSMT